jgi:hypothetical protein
VDPVNFITDEAMLSSLVQFYGFGGPSEDVIRTHLASLSPDRAPCCGNIHVSDPLCCGRKSRNLGIQLLLRQILAS